MAIETAARRYDLGFLPLQPEEYDFVIPTGRFDRPPVQRFVALLQDPATFVPNSQRWASQHYDGANAETAAVPSGDREITHDPWPNRRRRPAVRGIRHNHAGVSRTAANDRFGAWHAGRTVQADRHCIPETYPDVTVQAQFGGGRSWMARKITDLHQHADVLAVADYSVIPKYLFAADGRPAAATWYAGFARNAITFVYTDKSRLPRRSRRTGLIAS